MTGTEHSKLNIGFIGMGHMGSHMVPKPDQFDSNTPQTAGMRRSSAVSKQLAKGKLYTDKISTLGREESLHLAESDLITAASWWQDDLDDPLSEWMLTEACFDLLCQQIRGSYTAERFRDCLPRLQRFLCSGHRDRPHLYSQVCRWLGAPATVPEDEDQTKAA